MDADQYCVLWNNYHNHLSSSFQNLQRDNQLVDVTLVTSEGVCINAHQIVLAACSSFFKNFIKQISSKHPFILLPSEISFQDLSAMIEFMYTGQVCIEQDQIQDFIKSAQYFRIKGLEETNNDDSETDEYESIETQSYTESYKGNYKKRKIQFEVDDAIENDSVHNPIALGKEKSVKDHRYTQQVTLGDSDDNRDKWEEVDRKPLILTTSGSRGKRRRKKISTLAKSPVHLSRNVVCFQRKGRFGRSRVEKDEPINKVRRPGFLEDDEVDLCTCSAKKVWSTEDTDTLLKAWMETLNQVPPSYFIRSVSLCRRVARNLQQLGVQKNWKQCQVKMKNLRREVRHYKESLMKTSSRKHTEGVLTCEKLLPSIENIFHKEESIRREWYARRVNDKIATERRPDSSDRVLSQMATLVDSDLIDDEDTDGGGFMKEDPAVESETCYPSEAEDGVMDSFVSDQDAPSHEMHTGPDGTVVHHIVHSISDHSLSK